MTATTTRTGRVGRAVAVLGVATGLLSAPAAADAQQRDPRVGLRPGAADAEQAALGMELVTHVPRPAGFFNPAQVGDFSFANTDIAFRGDLLFLGNYHGVQVFDISNPAQPALRGTIVCPGGQGDVSVYGDLLFMSVEETRGRVDCGKQGVQGPVSAERFRGVRIFDISNLAAPRQVAAVQTCRGSHTHTLVPDPSDAGNVYVYVSGTSVVRSGEELPGCEGGQPGENPNTALFRIDVVKVPLASPQDARIVNQPRIFADPQTGNVAGLWPGGEHGPGTQRTSTTNQCHDITAYPEIGLAAGACSGNGILLDIRDPANPVRVEDVNDPNFAYWHSATFSNTGDKVIFTDEWGGGGQARCRATDRPQWGANALFRREGTELELAGYYKLPAPQTAQENCVAHNGNLVPVPGRDIMVQAWYQGGVSVFDFTDPSRPVELAFFDRGPMSATDLMTGGQWSTYWYNGHIYGSEIGRGLDVLRLTPGPLLSANEIEAAKLVRVEQDNPQLQQTLRWPAAFPVARAYVDQLERNFGLQPALIADVRAGLARAERMRGASQDAALRRLATQLEGWADRSADPAKVRQVAEVARGIAAR